MNVIKACCACVRPNNEPSAQPPQSTMARVCRTISCLCSCNLSVCPCFPSSKSGAQAGSELVSRVVTNYSQAEEGYLIEIPPQIKNFLKYHFVPTIDPTSSLVRKLGDITSPETGSLILDEAERTILLDYCQQLCAAKEPSAVIDGFPKFMDQLMAANKQPYELLTKAPAPLTLENDEYDLKVARQKFERDIHAATEEQKKLRTEDLHVPKEHFFKLPPNIRDDKPVYFFDHQVGYMSPDGQMVISANQRWKMEPDKRKVIYTI